MAVLLAALLASVPASAAPAIRAEVEPTTVAEDGTVRFWNARQKAPNRHPRTRAESKMGYPVMNVAC